MDHLLFRLFKNKQSFNRINGLDIKCFFDFENFKSHLKIFYLKIVYSKINRKNMISPTNAILTGMAVTDMFVIASYIPFAIHNFIRIDTSEKVMYSRGWAIFTLFHAHFTVVCHTISIWLTVILAIWRYLAVRYIISKKFNIFYCHLKNKLEILWFFFGFQFSN